MSRTAAPCGGPLSSYAISSTLVRTPLRRGARSMSRRSCLRLASALRLLAQVILGRASLGSRRRAVGIKLLLRDRDHAAVLAHFDQVEALRGILEHPVFALELGGHSLDRALDSERFVAADAMERLLPLSTRAVAVAARKSSCGVSVITFSGQVALHSAHCTQASSAKRSIGRSGLSLSAPVGQADTQARQSVQPSTLISIAPKGAPAGSAMRSTGAGAARCSSRNASRMRSRLPPTGKKVAGRGVPLRLSIARR